MAARLDPQASGWRRRALDHLHGRRLRRDVMRQQTAIGDVQFLRSMIPHHSGAILMCGESNLSDLEIKKLCDQIVASQREEISQMERILGRLNH
jgi:uncharacterized protein (DUF305 family)